MSFDLNWELYKTFYIVAKYGSFSKAAKKLYITQPSVSYSIKQLEEILETKLFYRNPNGIKLTAEGQELLNYVEKSYNLLKSGEKFLKEFKDFIYGEISVGVQSHIGEFFLFPFVEEFHSNYPNIKINIISRNTDQMIKLLENNKVDFVIDTSPIDTIYNNLEIVPLFDLQNCFVSKQKLSNKIKSLQDLNNYNLILPVKHSTPRKQLDHLCEQNNLELNPFMTIETTGLLVNAVKKNMGVGYVLKQAVTKDLIGKKLYEIKIEEKLPTLRLNLVYIDEYLTHVPRTFMNIIKEKYEEYM